MNWRNYIITILLILTWFAEDVYHFAPSGVWITPFVFSEMKVTMHTFIYDLATNFQYIIFGVCILIRNVKLHRITNDVIIMTIFLKVISLAWYVTKYGNPFYHSEWYVIFTVSLVIFGAIEFEKWDERNHRNNRNNHDIYFRGGNIRF